MKKIIIIGGGFAGVWSAVAAVRLVRQLTKQSEVEITLINKDEYHGLRPRFYESDLSKTRILLAEILAPLGVQIVIGKVVEINNLSQTVILQNQQAYQYDRLILATGSHLYTPPIDGLSEYGFNVDTYAAAEKLREHVQSLPHQFARGRYTIVVVGGGSVGIEIATDLIDRLQTIAPKDESVRVIVLDHTEIASALGNEPRQIIKQAFQALNIEMKININVKKIARDHIVLESGEIIDTQTVVWAAGMRANSLTEMFQLERDKLGRLPVDEFLRIQGISNCFAAGDVAAAKPDAEHYALLSCQHAMPQGRVAGNNVVADLFNQPLVTYSQPRFVTILDLGSWGAFYANGWEQRIVETGAAAKKIKYYINHERIYPPSIKEVGIEALLAAAEPVFKPIKV